MGWQQAANLCVHNPTPGHSWPLPSFTVLQIAAPPCPYLPCPRTAHSPVRVVLLAVLVPQNLHRLAMVWRDVRPLANALFNACYDGIFAPPVRSSGTRRRVKAVNPGVLPCVCPVACVACTGPAPPHPFKLYNSERLHTGIRYCNKEYAYEKEPPNEVRMSSSRVSPVLASTTDDRVT